MPPPERVADDGNVRRRRLFIDVHRQKRTPDRRRCSQPRKEIAADEPDPRRRDLALDFDVGDDAIHAIQPPHDGREHVAAAADWW
jgi:hypothetical protein